MLKFYVKVFRTSLFPKPFIDLVHVWYDKRYGSKIVRTTIPTPMHDLKVKVRLRTFMLKFYVKVFRTSLFLNPVICLVHIWYDDRYESKILHSTISDPVSDLQVKVTELELLCQSFLFVLRLNVPVNNFSVMSGRSHRFLGN